MLPTTIIRKRRLNNVETNFTSIERWTFPLSHVVVCTEVCSQLKCIQWKLPNEYNNSVALIFVAISATVRDGATP